MRNIPVPRRVPFIMDAASIDLSGENGILLSDKIIA
jgi:hypothetical protein